MESTTLMVNGLTGPVSRLSQLLSTFLSTQHVASLDQFFNKLVDSRITSQPGEQWSTASYTSFYKWLSMTTLS